MRLRQVVLVAKELPPAEGELRELFGLGPGYRDPGVSEFGLENTVLPIGDTFLEVVSPLRAGTAAGRYLERRGGDGGYMVMIQVDDAAAARRRVAALGIRVIWQADHSEDPAIRGTHLHPQDVGGAILSLDEATPPESWRWAGPDWQARAGAAKARRIVAVELEAADPAAMAARWGEVLERPVSQEGSSFVLLLAGGAVRFVETASGRGNGVSGFDVAVDDPKALLEAARGRGLKTGEDHLEVCGVRVTPK